MDTGLLVLDRTDHDSSSWLHGIQRSLRRCDRLQAFGVFYAVSHVLRDFLSAQAVTYLSAKLPAMLRAAFEEGWNAHAPRPLFRGEASFIEAVAANLPPTFSAEPRQATIAVFAVMSDRLSGRATEKILMLAPQELRALWPEQRWATGATAVGWR